VLKLIVDRKHQAHKHLTQRQPAFKKEVAFRTKNPKQGKLPILRCIALSTKLHYKFFLQVFYLTTQLLRITKGWEAEGLA
jgi:hypothetical protein